MSTQVLILGEMADGGLASSTRELLNQASSLCADTACEISVLLIGPDAGKVSERTIQFGAARVFTVSEEGLERYQPELWLASVEQLATQLEPALILLSHNAVGLDMAPRIAFRMNTAALMDCLEVRRDEAEDSFRVVKPIFGGSLRATYRSRRPPTVVTLRERVRPPAEAEADRTGEVVPFLPETERVSVRLRRVGSVSEKLLGPKLEEANVVVCGGRGLAAEDDLQALNALAELLGGVVGGTRPLCEKGWIDRHLQVGLTGKKVAPRLYIAIGVSGAVQHMAGVIGARNIVAINSDPKAEIYRHSHLGVVADFKDVLPPLISAVQAMQENGL